MLKAMLRRLDYDNYRIFVGHYRNDPATAAAIASVDDPRIEPVEVPADGPTTKADCLNYLYDALVGYELGHDCAAKAIVLHDAEDVVHRYELRIFDGLIDRAAVVQLPVLPLPDPHSRWIAGHYCDEFAEAHLKELVVNGDVGDDEERRAEDKAQKLTDDHVHRIDEMLKRKEAEIMEV